MTRTTARLCAALFTLALVGLAGPASAHVSVSSADAAEGGYGKAVFRVPNESETAATTKLVVTLPLGTPLPSVSAGVKPGWKISTTTSKLPKPTEVGDFTLTKAVHTITWTATGDGIPVGQFDEFSLSGGPFPDAKSIAFTARQTYDDGEVVDWDQVQKGDTEPEHPAPVLTLAAATADHHGADDDSVDSSTLGIAHDRDDTGRWLSGAALVVAVAALVVALRHNRRRA